MDVYRLDHDVVFEHAFWSVGIGVAGSMYRFVATAFMPPQSNHPRPWPWKTVSFIIIRWSPSVSWYSRSFLHPRDHRCKRFCELGAVAHQVQTHCGEARFDIRFFHDLCNLAVLVCKHNAELRRWSRCILLQARTFWSHEFLEVKIEDRVARMMKQAIFQIGCAQPMAWPSPSGSF